MPNKASYKKRCSHNCVDIHVYYVMASQERFELPTDGLEGRCSILLSYWDMLICNPFLEDIYYYISIFN